VLEAVSWCLPQLLKLFSGDVFAFEPYKPGDEGMARQASDYVNYIFSQDNRGFEILHSWFLDSLVTRNSYVKVYWSNDKEASYAEYTGLSDDEYQSFVRADDCDILEEHSYPSPDPHLNWINQNSPQLPPPAGPMQPPMGGISAPRSAGSAEKLRSTPPPNGAMNGGMNGMPPPNGAMPPAAMLGMQALMQPPILLLHDIKVRVWTTVGKVKIVNLPPDEVLVSKDAPDTVLDGTYFCAHRSLQTISSLREAGYDEDLIKEAINTPSSMDFSGERIDRFAQEEDFFVGDENRENTPNKRIWITEAYLPCDVDGDGISELRQIVFAGDDAQVILSNELCDQVPIISLCAFPQPHLHIGMSLADLLVDLQDCKSVIWRNTLDGLYLSTAPRFIVDEMAMGENSYDDLLRVRPGGVVRVNNVQGVQPLTMPFVGDQTLPLMQYIDISQEVRSGVSRQMAGLNPEALANHTATSASLISEAGSARIELIGRLFAEQIKVLGRRILGLVTKFQQTARVVRITGEWHEFDVRNWRESMDLRVDVGLGAGNAQEQMVALNTILSMQNQIAMLQKGVDGPILTAKNVFDALEKFTQAAGFKQSFFTDPKTMPPAPQQQPPSPEMALAQATIAAQNAKAQSDIAVSRMKAENQMMLEKQRAMHEYQLEQQKLEHDIALEHAREQAKNDVAMMQAQLKAQHDAAVAAKPAEPRATRTRVTKHDDSGRILEYIKEEVNHGLAE
jgi:hypothetical protein